MFLRRLGPIPITLLSGFLGSGKTTLLEHILTAKHGLKIAVIINDVSKLNIDAALLQNHKVTNKEEKLIQLQNGCICCTLRGDLLEELVALAKSKAFQYIVIESTGISEPMQVAETFTTEFTEMLLETSDEIDENESNILKEIVKSGGLNKLTKLDTCVTVVDALNFFNNLETTDFLIDRFGDHGSGEQERTITDLLIDQIEFANVIIINKVATVSGSKLKKIEKAIKTLNPIAKIIKTNYSKVDIKDVVNTKLYEFEKAQLSAGWLQSLNEMTIREGFGAKKKNVLTPKPETEEYGINNFVYQAKRPFHPERLFDLIKDKFVILERSSMNQEQLTNEAKELTEQTLTEEEEEESEEEETNEEDEIENGISENEYIRNKKKSALGPVLRSKGFIWLASRYINRGEWSSAGSMLTINGGIPWFDIIGIPPTTKEAAKLIKQELKQKYGDRRNEIVFIGLGIDSQNITKLLDSCLVTDEELNQFDKIIKSEKKLINIEKRLQREFSDGFEDWILLDEDDKQEEKEVHNEHTIAGRVHQHHVAVK
ncbi:hypothetical protein DFJ63DRAFT_290439 [Scheffersomyces coipomensis]|uniref:uncharacterized protein n=1 Tax=Scheffersomyces coipomensis TaxID=1788519 RepID=UPI00315DF522